MAVLEAIGERPMRAKDLADHLGLKWTTAYRTLAHLEEEEYLARDSGTGEYSVGARLYLLGSSYLATNALAQVASPHLKAASDRSACASQANERQGLQVLTVAAVDSPDPIRKTSPGFYFPLGVAAKGRLLLAFAPAAVQEQVLARPLPSFTEFSIADPDELRNEIQRIRQQRRALAREDLQLGVGSVAAPVLNREGAVVGCVSLVVRSARLDDEGSAEALLSAVGDTAHEISVAVGWQPVSVAV